MKQLFSGWKLLPDSFTWLLFSVFVNYAQAGDQDDYLVGGHGNILTISANHMHGALIKAQEELERNTDTFEKYIDTNPVLLRHYLEGPSSAFCRGYQGQLKLDSLYKARTNMLLTRNILQYWVKTVEIDSSLLTVLGIAVTKYYMMLGQKRAHPDTSREFIVSAAMSMATGLSLYLRRDDDTGLLLYHADDGVYIDYGTVIHSGYNLHFISVGPTLTIGAGSSKGVDDTYSTEHSVLSPDLTPVINMDCKLTHQALRTACSDGYCYPDEPRSASQNYAQKYASHIIALHRHRKCGIDSSILYNMDEISSLHEDVDERSQYRKLAKLLHPDRHQANKDLFREAWQILKTDYEKKFSGTP